MEKKSPPSRSIGFVFVAALALGASGCWFLGPFGDCWGKATILVSVAKTLSIPASAPLLVGEVVRIEPGDVTGTSPDGLPLGPAADRARILPVTIDAATSVGQAEDPGTDPYPIWYFAFADLNNNGHPDAGEPFGVDPRNPSSSGCGRYQGMIVIDKTLD